MLIIEFSYNFLYVGNCMKLYDKKFFNYGNCMIRSVGQRGKRKLRYFTKTSFTQLEWCYAGLDLY